MSTQFVTHALSCSLGRGIISLKGTKKRPWLEISRCETERSLLSYQSKLLKQLHEGPIDYFKDRIPGKGFYDQVRFRFHGDQLYKAYELLYPRDKRCISQSVLEITGKQGLALLWTDQGRINGRRGSLRGKYSPEEYQNIAKYMNTLGIEASPHSNQLTTIEICLSRSGLTAVLNIVADFLPKGVYNGLSRRRTMTGTPLCQGA